jgi:hypothetical protein
MNVSNQVNTPVKLDTNCWQTICQNKKNIAIATAGVVIVALAAINYYSQRQSLYHMQDSLLEVAESAKGIEHSEGGGGSIASNIGTDMRCPHSYTPYKLEVVLSKSTPDVTGLVDQVKGLYNNATSYGTDLFSRYGFYATRDSVVKDSDTVKATFIICRSSLNNLFSAPWRE